MKVRNNAKLRNNFISLTVTRFFAVYKFKIGRLQPINNRSLLKVLADEVAQYIYVTFNLKYVRTRSVDA